MIKDHEGHDKVVLFTELGLSDYGNLETDKGQKDDVITILIPSDQSHALTYISNKYKSFFHKKIL